MDAQYNHRQLLSLMSLSALSPILRLYPGKAAELGGKAAWLSPLAALPVLLLYGALLARLYRRSLPGEGLPELAARLLGPVGGRLLQGLLGLWLLLYGAFLLRAGAERFVVTAFPFARPAFFIVVLGLSLLPAALGKPRSLVRMARLLLPVVLVVVLALLAAGLLKAEESCLLPVTSEDLPRLALSAAVVIDLVSPMLYLPGFLLPGLKREEKSLVGVLLWVTGLCLCLTLLGAAVLGRFGPELSARLSQPFFTLVRNLVLFRGLERMEALVVSLWLFPDFLLGALLLGCSWNCLCPALGVDREREFLLPLLSGGRWLLWLCGAAMIALALLLWPGKDGYHLWSETVIPLCNLSVAFLLLPGLCLLARQKEKRM